MNTILGLDLGMFKSWSRFRAAGSPGSHGRPFRPGSNVVGTHSATGSGREIRGQSQCRSTASKRMKMPRPDWRPCIHSARVF
jgi:hypothetical protein